MSHPIEHHGQLIQVGAVAERLGVAVSTARRWLDAQLIPSLKINGRRYSTTGEVEAFLRRVRGGEP